VLIGKNHEYKSLIIKDEKRIIMDNAEYRNQLRRKIKCMFFSLVVLFLFFSSISCGDTEPKDEKNECLLNQTYWEAEK